MLIDRHPVELLNEGDCHSEKFAEGGRGSTQRAWGLAASRTLSAFRVPICGGTRMGQSVRFHGENGLSSRDVACFIQFGEDRVEGVS